MPLYHLVLDARRFHEQIAPALAASWTSQSFVPCRALCAALSDEARSYAERYGLGADEPLLARVVKGLPFDRRFWRLLAGELFLYAAVDIPEIQTAPVVTCCLLAPDHCNQEMVSREQFAPIEQAHFGARDLVFGAGFYHPEHAGYNDQDDVARLAGYLASINPHQWTLDDLAYLREPGEAEERQEELEFAREWFPALQDLYQRAENQDQVIVCEVL